MENTENITNTAPVAENTTIKPEAIVLDDDSDMPEPETKSYEQFVKCTPKFMSLFMDTMGKLPYASVLKNANGEQIKLIALVKFVEAHANKISINDMNHIVSFIAGIEFRYSRQLMEEIESQDGQRTLWELVEE